MKLTTQLKHFIAIAILFFVMSLFFGKLLFGDVLVQSDIIQYQGMSSEIQKYQELEGATIHWTNSMFGGMPTYLMTDALFLTSNITQWLNHLIRSILPGSAGIFMIGLVCFYILCQSFKLNQWISVIGAFMFAAGSFVIISLVAGHNSKINAFAYAPLIIAGIIYIFRRKPWLGMFCLAFGLAAQLAANHLQITFYTFLICLCLFISEVIFKAKKEGLHGLLKPILFSVAGVILAIGVNYNKVYTIYNHAQYTIRGGDSALPTNNVKESSGLDYDYATQWSYRPIETFTTIIPNFMGGSSNEELGQKSHWYGEQQIPASLRNSPPTYWGVMPFTAGPVYIGAIACALFLFAFFIVDGRKKWWILAGSILMILLSWGKFSLIYDFFFYNFPFFNKFRTPMMSLLMLSLLFPLLASLGIDEFLKKPKLNQKQFLFALAIPIAVILLFGFVASTIYGYSGAVDEQLKSAGFPNNLIALLKQDRAMLLRNDAIRSLLLVIVFSGVLFAFLKNKVKLMTTIIAIAALVFIDLFFINQRYIGAENFESKDQYNNRFSPNGVNQGILKDDSHYRVLNLATGNPFSEATTSLHHKSIGGYHAA